MKKLIDRRHVLLSTLFGAGALGLRSLASGIPAAVLTAPAACAYITGQSSTGQLDGSEQNLVPVIDRPFHDPCGDHAAQTLAPLDPRDC